MQKTFFILFLLAITLPVTAQRITYLDLKYALYHNVEDTENYLAKKGFSFGGIDTLDIDDKAFDYSFTKNSSTSVNYISVSKKTFHNVFTEVSLFTLNQDDYLKIKAYIKTIGYKLSSSKTLKLNGVLFVYTLKSNEIHFMVVRNKETENTNYYISLSDSALETSAFEKIDY